MKLEVIVLAVVVLFVAAFAYISSTGNHEWGGSDDQSVGVIADLTGGTYQPWFHSVWEPPSREIEGLLFALQAAIGSLIIGYFLGYYRAMAKMKAAKAVEETDGKPNARPAR
jgi:cobalt/nickel transport protein